MKVIAENHPSNVVVLRLDGKILIGEGDQALRDVVLRALDNGSRRILLDLHGVPYVDGAGLGEIVRCYTSAARKGSTLSLVNPTKRVRDFLVIVGLYTVFKVYDTLELALQAPVS